MCGPANFDHPSSPTSPLCYIDKLGEFAKKSLNYLWKSCFSGLVGRGPELRDCLSLVGYPQRVDRWIEVIELRRNRTDTKSKDVYVLAKSISDATLPLLLDFDARHPSGSSVDALYAAYRLAETIKTQGFFTTKLWHELDPEIQNLFEKLAPYQVPPEIDRSHSLPFCSFTPSQLTSGQWCDLTFSDHCRFRVTWNRWGMGNQLFSIDKAALTGIGKVPPTLYSFIEEYTADLPPYMDEFFNSASLLKELANYESAPNLRRDIGRKTLQQIMVMKEEYLKMVLSSLGIPIDQPLAVSRAGEWYITPKGEISLLSEEKFEEYTPEQVSKTAAAIHSTFLFERKYGVALLDLGTHRHSVNSLFAVRHLSDGPAVFLWQPLKQLAFIEGKIAEKHSELEKGLRRILPSNLCDKIFTLPFADADQWENTASLLALIIDKGYLTSEDLLEKKPDAVDVLKKIVSTKAFKEASIVIPWESLKNLTELQIFLGLSQETEDLRDLIEISQEIIRIVIDILAQGFITKDRHEKVNLDFEKIADNDLKLRSDLTRLVFSYLIKNYFKNPTESLDDLFNSLISTIDSTIEKMNIVEHFSDFSGLNLPSYLTKTLWTPLAEIMNQRLYPETSTLAIEEEIALIRAVHLSSDKSKEAAAAVLAALYKTLHLHMKAHEKRRIAERYLAMAL